MERLKKARIPIRSGMTRTVNELETEIEKLDFDKNILEFKMIKLQNLLGDVSELNEKIKDLMLDSDVSAEIYEEELILNEEYEDRVQFVILKTQKILNASIQPGSPAMSRCSCVSENTGKRRNFKLPKIELKKFNGDPVEWLGWWAQFSKIHEDGSLHETDKFQYLCQAMVENTRASKLVATYPQSAENYPKVIEALTERFGDKVILSEVYVRQLLKMVLLNNNSETITQISTLYDELESHIRALETLGVTANQSAIFLYPLVESSMPEEIVKVWQRSSLSGYDDGVHKGPEERLQALMKFLKAEVKGAERLAYVKAGLEEPVTKPGNKGKKREGVPTVASLHVGQKEACIFCQKTNHGSAVCYKAKNMSLDERKSAVKESRACYGCLKRGHGFKMCRSSIRCSCCGKKHFAILCPGNSSDGQNSLEVQGSKENDQAVKVTTTNTSGASSGGLVLMKTVRVLVKGSTGQEIQARLLFDEGSQKSYIKTSVADQLLCPVLERFVQQNNLFGGHVTECKSRKLHEVVVKKLTGGDQRKISLINEDIICSSCPTIPQGPWIAELERRKIHVMDTIGGETDDIQILIGSDLRESLMTGRRYKMECGLVAVESVFGWTLSGQLPCQDVNCASTVISMHISEERSLPKLWDLEMLGIRDIADKISDEEKGDQVKKTLQSTLIRDDEGRYFVHLPWINIETELPSNRGVAEIRLRTVTEKLRSKDMFGSYDKVFRDWELENLIEVHHEEGERKNHFLPHRPVLKPESTTTPIRPVFDASCKVGKGPSLNQCLEKGPNMLQLIPSILTRFREKKIGVTADIRKAFQMVGVVKEDRNYQKFLWWEGNSLKEYRHCRVVFGMNCSPFILAAVLDYHLTRVSEADKKIADLIKKSLYVDNCVTSLDSAEELDTFKGKAIALLADAKMDLRQWESSVDNNEESDYTKVLGINWDKKEDCLFCQPPNLNQELVVTKRKVLSIIAQVFDPIGFTCPALLQAKMMLQDSWVSKIGWDQEWNPEQEKEFRKWYTELPKLGLIRIPRQTFVNGTPRSIQLHIFCDASKKAYAAVVYARSQDEDQVIIQLLAAKSRLAPLDKKGNKSITINRLELMGCVIGARLAETINTSLDLHQITRYFWTDSTTALAWIKREEDWGTFVGNRSREIGLITGKEEWRYVPGILNPADLPSRGCSPAQLLESKWWEGPTWLKDKAENWPKFAEATNEEEVYLEKKSCSHAMVGNNKQQPRFSSYIKNVRVATYVRRFIENCRNVEGNRSVSPFLTIGELKRGEKDLLCGIQKHYYSTEPKVKNLNVTLKNDGLYHIKTRLVFRDDLDLFREPILLPSEEPLVHQLIEYIHRSNCHAGTQFVLGKLRERYWIPKGRKTVGRVIQRCTVCRRFSSKSLPCEPASLPKDRVQNHYAFQTTGVDLAGPLMLKGGKKAWVVLYTCALYRGVHLDIVDSLSAEEFLDSLEKFTCLVGRTSHIYSDNGTNFVGAHSLLKKIDWKKAEKLFQVKMIKWSFNPPTAAWWGGWWERLIRSIKELLKRMLGTAKLTRRELEKCLAAVTHTINNRPLTTLTEDSEDMIPLIPAMFMRDLPIAGLPERELITGQDLQESYRKIQELKSFDRAVS